MLLILFDMVCKVMLSQESIKQVERSSPQNRRRDDAFGPVAKATGRPVAMVTGARSVTPHQINACLSGTIKDSI